MKYIRKSEVRKAQDRLTRKINRLDKKIARLNKDLQKRASKGLVLQAQSDMLGSLFCHLGTFERKENEKFVW